MAGPQLDDIAMRGYTDHVTEHTDETCPAHAGGQRLGHQVQAGVAVEGIGPRPQPARERQGPPARPGKATRRFPHRVKQDQAQGLDLTAVGVGGPQLGDQGPAQRVQRRDLRDQQRRARVDVPSVHDAEHPVRDAVRMPAVVLGAGPGHEHTARRHLTVAPAGAYPP